MKYLLIAILLIASPCYAQHWEMEVMGGASGYLGDLTQGNFYFKSQKPVFAFNLRYNIDDAFIIRAGVAMAKVGGDDKNNTQVDIKARNLNFQSDIQEISLCLEYNLLEPELNTLTPYIFGGIGMFRFDPYTYDKNNVKIFLQPLSTEGQGLPQFPGRKPYSLTQFCVPFGAGVKFNLSSRWDIVYEAGFRFLFTDYLDDVSTTYVDLDVLLQERGPKAVELAYRAEEIPFTVFVPHGNGNGRGSPRSNDWYFFNGLKLAFHFGRRE